MEKAQPVVKKNRQFVLKQNLYLRKKTSITTASLVVVMLLFLLSCSQKEVEQTAAALGISVNELLGLDKTAKRSATAGTKTVNKVLPKYRDAHGNTWTGRGQKPVWMRDAIAQGAKQEDFLIG